MFSAEGDLEWLMTMGSGLAVPGGAGQHRSNLSWYLRKHLRMYRPKNINRVKKYVLGFLIEIDTNGEEAM